MCIPFADSVRHILDIRLSRMKPNGKSKADFRLGGKQTFAADAKNTEVVTQGR